MGVVAFAKSLADEVGRDGILINNVCPGSILSERMLSNVTARAKELGISVEEGLPSAPRDRRAALGNRNWRTWWRSWPGKSSYITGTAIPVDAAWCARVIAQRGRQRRTVQGQRRQRSHAYTRRITK
jgi:3-oxoacyl-[acyl-carrier protein] reductase